MAPIIEDQRFEGDDLLLTLRLPAPAITPATTRAELTDMVRGYLLRRVIAQGSEAEAARRLATLIDASEAAWIVQRILGAPDVTTTVRRLKALFSPQELAWLCARITEAQA